MPPSIQETVVTGGWIIINMMMMISPPFNTPIDIYSG